MKSTKKRILIFSDWFLPGYKAGGPIRSLSTLIEHLKDDFEIFLVCGDRDYLESESYRAIPLNKWIANYGIKLLYLPPKNQQISTYTAIIEKLNPNTVYINGIFSNPFSIKPLLALRKTKRSIVLAPRGMLAKGALNIKSFKKASFLKFAKLIKIFVNVHFHATSESEKLDIQKHFKNNLITVIPNLPSLNGVKNVRKVKLPGKLKILTVARIAPEKNISFALDCLKNIKPDIEIEMDVIGTVYDKEYMKKCTSILKTLPKNVSVQFTGSANPSEIQDCYPSTHLFFLPTLGENYGHAIVESLMSGIPVLISDKTPWKNLEKDKLGAEFSLNDQSKFADFIEDMAAMTPSDYNDYTSGIAKRLSKRIDLKGNISSYKELFHAKG